LAASFSLCFLISASALAWSLCFLPDTFFSR
jgi:hypothetical protein